MRGENELWYQNFKKRFNLKFIKTVIQADLFKITSLNSLSVILRLFIGLITSKVIAIFIGPSGMAVVGNFRNFVGSFETISTLGSQNGIVKYVAESRGEVSKLKKQVSTIFISVLFVSVFLSFILFFFASYWNEVVFGSVFKNSFIFKVFAFALPWYALSLVLVAIINGLGQFRKVIYIAIIGNCIGLVVSVLFVSQLQTTGALLSIILTPSLLFIVAFYFISKELPLIDLIKFSYFDFKVIKNLSHYFLMALVSGIIGSLVFLSIRKNIIANIGITDAGYWEAITRISSYYLLFISSILTIYYLPKLVLSKNYKESKNIIWSYYKNIFPFILVALVLVYFARFLIVKVLFTAAFIPVSGLFFWQLVGDTLKAASLILGYQFLAKKLTVAFIVSELLSLSLNYFSSVFLISIYGIQGVVMAHALTYLAYLLGLSFYFRRVLTS